MGVSLMAVLRLLLLIVGTVAQRAGMTAPNSHPPTGELREQRGLERSLDWVLASFTALVWFWSSFEGPILFALSGYCPSALASPFLHALPAKLTSEHSQVTPTFLTGIVLAVGGALLRIHCYRTLGKHFTFQLSLRPTHTLITSGVYSIVRHPSYTGFTMLAAGYLFCVLDRQGPIVSVCTGLLGGHDTERLTVTCALMGAWTTGGYLVYVLLYGRMNREDEMLRKNFGEAWRVWAKKVPYRLLPGVY